MLDRAEGWPECACSSPDCRLHGCLIARSEETSFTTPALRSIPEPAAASRGGSSLDLSNHVVSTPPAKRSTLWLRQLLVSIDQLAYVLIAGPIYILFGGPCPSADETISSRVGRAQLAGQRWGIVLAWIIDRLFLLLGAGPDHCRRNVETAFLGKPPTA